MTFYVQASQDEVERDEDEDSGTFTSSKRSQLVGMYCYVSTDKQGYLYDVFSNHVRLQDVFPYTAQVMQVSDFIVFTFVVQ